MVASLPDVWTHVAPWVIPGPPIRELGRIHAFYLGVQPYECQIRDVRYSNWKVQASVAIGAIYAVSLYKWQHTLHEADRLLASSARDAVRRNFCNDPRALITDIVGSSGTSSDEDAVRNVHCDGYGSNSDA